MYWLHLTNTPGARSGFGTTIHADCFARGLRQCASNYDTIPVALFYSVMIRTDKNHDYRFFPFDGCLKYPLGHSRCWRFGD